MSSFFQIIGDIKSTKVIAAGNSIREVKRLRKVYGFGRWRKLKGFADIRFSHGGIVHAELHWYEAHWIGKKEIKIKQILKSYEEKKKDSR